MYEVSLARRTEEGNIDISSQGQTICREEYDSVKEHLKKDNSSIKAKKFFFIDDRWGFDGHGNDRIPEGFRFLKFNMSKCLLPKSFSTLLRSSKRENFNWLDFEEYKRSR